MEDGDFKTSDDAKNRLYQAVNETNANGAFLTSFNRCACVSRYLQRFAGDTAF